MEKLVDLSFFVFLAGGFLSLTVLNIQLFIFDKYEKLFNGLFIFGMLLFFLGAMSMILGMSLSIIY